MRKSIADAEKGAMAGPNGIDRRLSSLIGRTIDKMEQAMKILVPVKRVIDYNVKPRVKADGTGVDLADRKSVV